MTPAINQLKKLKIAHKLHPYDHDPNNTDFGKEAAEKLGVDPTQVFKTLIVVLNDDEKKLGCVVLPVANMLNLKKAAKALGVKRLDLAPIPLAQKVTGYLVGGVSPVGQKKLLPTVIDASATNFPVIYVSGGKRGLDVEISPQDLANVVKASFADILD